MSSLPKLHLVFLCCDKIVKFVLKMFFSSDVPLHSIPKIIRISDKNRVCHGWSGCGFCLHPYTVMNFKKNP